MQIGWPLPALHPHRRQVARLDQLRQPRTGLRHRHAEIVAQVALGRDTHGPGGDRQQGAVGVFLARRRRIDDGGRQYPFGQIVDPLEAAPGLGGDQPGPEKPFQRPLAVAPFPPAGLALGSVGEIAADGRPVLLDPAQHAVDIVRPLTPEPRQPAPELAVPRPRHPPAQQRLHRQRQQRRLMPPIFEQRWFLAPGRLLQQSLRIGPQPRKRRQIVGAHHHIDRIHLDQAGAFKHPAEMFAPDAGPGPGFSEPLRRKSDPARLEGGKVGIHRGA